MTDAVSVIVSVFLGVSAAVPVALIVAMAMRQPRDVVDFAGWIPPDEIIETTAVTLYFDATGQEVASGK